jgi:hypothetical protein
VDAVKQHPVRDAVIKKRQNAMTKHIFSETIVWNISRGCTEVKILCEKCGADKEYESSEKCDTFNFMSKGFFDTGYLDKALKALAKTP